MPARSRARLLPAAVGLAAAALLVVDLTRPAEVVFDEVYYVDDARAMLEQGLPDREVVHPPLGTWLIAGGIAVLGDGPLGWRLPVAVAGAASVGLVLLLARRLLGRPAPAALVALLVAADGVFLVQMRTAMLDGFLVAFALLGAWLLLVAYPPRDTAAGPVGGSSRWALAAAGVAFGLAVATKWAGALALAAAVTLALVWEVGRRRRAPGPRGRAGGLARGVAVVALALGVVPALVYAATWWPTLGAAEQLAEAPEAEPAAAEAADDPATGGVPEALAGAGDGRLTALVAHHRHMLEFHLALEAEHRYAASAATWPLQARPVTFHWSSCDEVGLDRDSEPCAPAGIGRWIASLGNLALWWPALLAVPALAWRRLRGDGRGTVALAFLAAQWLPWLFVARPVFAFYAAPLVPFVALAVVQGTTLLDGWHPARGVSAGAAARGLLALAALALALYFAPVWLGLPWDLDALRARWWFDSWV